MDKVGLKVEGKIRQLENRGYAKTVDAIGQYLKGADIYYKRIVGDIYVVFDHYHKGKKEWLQGFDCWIGSYDTGYAIGRTKAASSEHVKSSFDFNKDWPLVYQKIEELQKVG